MSSDDDDIIGDLTLPSCIMFVCARLALSIIILN